MERVENVLHMPEAQFKRIIGTTKVVVSEMLSITNYAHFAFVIDLPGKQALQEGEV